MTDNSKEINSSDFETNSRVMSWMFLPFVMLVTVSRAMSMKEGETKFIEVKKINKAGDDFLITDNEMFTARQKGISYYLLLIVQSGEALPSHYSLINYPLPMLNEKVERRAVKHENFCSGYKANYLKLNFSSPEDS